MKNKTKPNSIIIIMAYLSLLCLGGLLGGMLVFTIVIPPILEMGSFFQGAAILMACLAILSILFGVAAILALLGVWQGQDRGRTGTLILATLLVAISALSIPFLLFTGIWGIALFVPLTTAVCLIAASAAVWWGMSRPTVRAYFV